MKQLTLNMASVPDKESVVSEIWFGDDQVAELSNESSCKLVIEIYPPPEGGVWTFDLEDFHSILVRARDNLNAS